MKEVRQHAHSQGIRNSHGGSARNSWKSLPSAGRPWSEYSCFPILPTEGKALTRIVVDDPAAAKKVLDSERLTYTESDVPQVKFPHRPGELARAASRLGEADININHGYCGVEPGTNVPLLIFGVVEVGRAVTILEQAVSAAAVT